MNFDFYNYFFDPFFGENKFSVITARRREGKTYHAVIWLGLQVLQNPNSRGLWVDTSQSNLDKYYDRYWYPIFKEIFQKQIAEFSRQAKIMKFKNGSIIDFVSAERPENMEGFGYDYIVCNEAGIIFKKASLWDNTLSPMAKNAKKVIFIGTPKSKNKFFQLAQMEITNPSWKTFRVLPEVSNQWTAEELAYEKSVRSDANFRQEICGEFVEEGADVFRIAETDTVMSLEPTVVLGVDLGRYEDETVVIGLDSRLKTTFIESWGNESFEIQKARILAIWAKLGYPKVNLDATGLGISVFDSLKIEMGNLLEGFNFSNKLKNDLVENAKIQIETGKHVVYNDSKLVSQLTSYEHSTSKLGANTYSAPDGMHDDYVIALILALWEFRGGLQVKANFFVT